MEVRGVDRVNPDIAGEPKATVGSLDHGRYRTQSSRVALNPIVCAERFGAKRSGVIGYSSEVRLRNMNYPAAGIQPEVARSRLDDAGDAVERRSGRWCQSAKAIAIKAGESEFATDPNPAAV